MQAPTVPLLAIPPLPFRRLECRVHQRFACEIAGFCQPASAPGSQEMKWAATACDISQGGMRVLLRRRYEPGSGLAIELPDKDGQEGHTYLAKVIHVRPSGGGFWAHGCRFVSPLSEEELTRLLGPEHNVAPAPANNSTIAEVNFQLASDRGPLLECQFKQLRISRSWPLAAGKTVSLRGGGNSSAWSLRVQVMECLQEAGRWTLRCRLPRSPSSAHLLRALSTGAGMA